MAEQHFQVDLRGIVELLSHNLYSSSRVYLRELVQNARDAIVARRGLDPSAPARIEIVVDEDRDALAIRDTGIGLTETEMRDLLATIGASSKVDELGLARGHFLGQFGIGLLSCFLVADSIEVVSRSARSEQAPTMRWVGQADGTYTLTPNPTELTEPGTVVRLHARPDDRDWVGLQRVRNLVDRFAALLEIPITVAAAGAADPGPPLSTRPAPWQQPAAHWCRAEFGFDPLLEFPLEIPAAGIRAVAYVSDTEGNTGNRAGDVIYSRRMFVAAGNTQLLPPWAHFIRVIAESGDLALTASRESLKESLTLERIRAELGEQIRERIGALERTDPAAFHRFLAVHATGLQAMAVNDDTMLRFVFDHVTWETTEGPRTLRELTASGDQVHYVTSATNFTGFAPFLRASGRVLINGGYAYGREVLDAVTTSPTIAARGPIRLRRFELTDFLDGLDHPRSIDRALADTIRERVAPRLASLGVVPDLRSFQPPSVASVFAPGLGPVAAEPDPDDDWADLLSDLGMAEAAPQGPRLVLNVLSPVVRLLGDSERGTDEVIDTLHTLGLLMAGRRLDAQDTERLSAALGTLLSAATRTHP